MQLDPDNAGYQRDLSISYERLGDLDRAAGRPGDAARRYLSAVDIRRRLLQREPQRVDLAEELGVALRLLAETTAESGQRADTLGEIIGVLAPFERAATITPKGTAVLAWARQ